MADRAGTEVEIASAMWAGRAPGTPTLTHDQIIALTRAAIKGHLDSLLGELPQSPVLAALFTHRSTLEDIKQGIHKGGTDDAVRRAIEAFLRSLRDSLASGREGKADG